MIEVERPERRFRRLLHDLPLPADGLFSSLCVGIEYTVLKRGKKAEMPPPLLRSKPPAAEPIREWADGMTLEAETREAKTREVRADAEDAKTIEVEPRTTEYEKPDDTVPDAVPSQPLLLHRRKMPQPRPRRRKSERSPTDFAVTVPQYELDEELLRKARRPDEKKPVTMPRERLPEEKVVSAVKELAEQMPSVRFREIAEEAPKKKFVAEVDDDRPLFDSGMPHEEDSVNASLSSLQEIEEERRVREAVAKAEKLKKKAEEARKATERAAKKKAEEEARRKAREETKRAAEEAARKAAEEARRLEQEKRRIETEPPPAPEITGESIEISVEVEVGLPWVDDHVYHNLTDGEMATCEVELPNTKKRWILPVPEGETPDEKLLLHTMKEQPQVELDGQDYYIFYNYVTGAKMCARVDDKVHIWPAKMTSAEFLESIGADKGEYEEVRWKRGLFAYEMSKDELEGYEKLLPEKAPKLMHPVPRSDTKHEENIRIMKLCEHLNIPTISLGGEEYYLFEMPSMEGWKETVVRFPKSRMVMRKDKVLSLWDESDNGLSIFEGVSPRQKTTGSIPPLPPKGRFVPRDSELPRIKQLYAGGKKRRHLFQLKQDISAMDADTLHTLVVIANTSIKQGSPSPLLLVRDKWHIALESPLLDSKETSLEDGQIVVHGLPTTQEVMFRLKEEVKKRKESRKKVMDMIKQYEALFPEDTPRYLLEAEENSLSQYPAVYLPDGKGGKMKWWYTEKPIPGWLEVRRIKAESDWIWTSYGRVTEESPEIPKPPQLPKEARGMASDPGVPSTPPPPPLAQPRTKTNPLPPPMKSDKPEEGPESS